MTKLTERIQAVGIVHKCDSTDYTANSISENEAIEIRDLLKQKFLDVIYEVEGCSDSADYANAVIEAMENIK